VLPTHVKTKLIESLPMVLVYNALLIREVGGMKQMKLSVDLIIARFLSSSLLMAPAKNAQMVSNKMSQRKIVSRFQTGTILTVLITKKDL
jgi:hypothetical protein